MNVDELPTIESAMASSSDRVVHNLYKHPYLL